MKRQDVYIVTSFSSKLYLSNNMIRSGFPPTSGEILSISGSFDWLNLDPRCAVLPLETYKAEIIDIGNRQCTLDLS